MHREQLLNRAGTHYPGNPGCRLSEKAGYPKLMRDCKRAMSAENATEEQRMRTKKKTCVVAAGMILAAVSVAFAAFFQGFEVNTAGWTGATRVPAGTDGVPSKTGVFHAEDANLNAFTYTFWGGASKTFPPGGYTTSVDIYLDISPPYMTGSVLPYNNDTRFDWTSAIGTPQCGHLREFVFNAGFYTDTDTTGAGPRFVISASNNAGRGSSFPKNPGRDPFTINMEGWYTFEHRFYGVTGGQLSVDLIIKNAAGLPLKTWTLSTATDIIGTVVGGNYYGWFVQNEFPAGLAFDTTMLLGFQDYCTVPPSTAGAKVTAGGWITAVGGKGTFGLTAKGSGPSGNLTYQDHGLLPRTVKSTAVTSVTVTDNCAQILGTATVNGAGSFTFDVDVCDNGEPGKDADTFSISMSDGYTAVGTLRGGNVQIHK
jgi:hypothetical protein